MSAPTPPPASPPLRFAYSTINWDTTPDFAAIVAGFIESERTGRVVAVEEVASGRTTPYQGEIEAMLVAGASLR